MCAGVWRRAKIADYNTGHPHWQTLLDIDKLDNDSGKNWVWKGADCTKRVRSLPRSACRPAAAMPSSFANSIPRPGPSSKDGFDLPVAKSNAQYVNDNTILFATDFGKGTMTPSSYPRIVKLWHRGEPIAKAQTLFEGKPNDMVAGPEMFHGPYGTIALIVRRPSFFKADYYDVAANGGTAKIDVPDDAELHGVTDGQLIFTLQSAWTPKGGKTIPQGSLIAVSGAGLRQDGHVRAAAVLFTPDDARDGRCRKRRGRAATPSMRSIYKDVTGSVHAFHLKNGNWTDTVLDLPKNGSTERRLDE